MDVLRILSRSTAKPRAASKGNERQLAQQPSKKNKRRHDVIIAHSFSAEDDFSLKAYVENEFLGITNNEDVSGPDLKRRKIQDVREEEKPTTAEDEALTPEGGVLGRAELKSFLKKHKLKYTVVSGSLGTETSKHSKSKKKTKKKKKSSKDGELGKDSGSTEVALMYQPLRFLGELQTRYNISHRLYENVSKQGFTHPTEVQTGSLPLLLKSRSPDASIRDAPEIDLMTIAPTGSGKTLAFALPLVDYLIARRHDEKQQAEDGTKDVQKKGIKAVILAPTRELADQIVNEVLKLIQGTGIRVAGMRKSMIPRERRPKRVKKPDEDDDSESTDDESYDESDMSSEEEEDGEYDGGVKVNGSSNVETPGPKKIPALKTDILVSTPLLLLHAVETCPDIFDLSGVTKLVLDEADVLLDPIFADQTLPIVEHISNENLHFSFWSATMPSATEEKIAGIVNSRAPSSSSYQRTVVRLIAGIKDSALPTISQSITYAATERGKLLALRQMFRSSLQPPCLVFVQTIPRAQALYNEILYDLPTAPGKIAVLHSSLSDKGRAKVMDSFRAGEIWVLITTDLLSRGVDFRGVNVVVNYDIPTSVASYIHRIGRTGRAGREGGKAVTYYTKEDVPHVRGVVGVIQKSGGKVEQWMLDSLPKPTKEEKRKLKRLGVEQRRANFGDHGSGAAKMRISSKSGYERQKENRKKGAIEASKRRKKEQYKLAQLHQKRQENGASDGDADGYESWEGFSD